MKPGRAVHLMIAVCLTVLVSACGLPVHLRTVQAPLPVPAITFSAARRVLAAYQAAKHKADAQRSTTILGQYETGSMLALDAARYRIESRVNPSGKARPATYVRSRFYIPRLALYPRWFVVQTARSDDTEGRAIYLVFERSSVVATGWRLALAPSSSKGAKLPTVTLDSQGYAMTVSDGQPLVVRPRSVSSAHADVLTQGTGSDEAARFAPDPFTASLRAGDALEAAQLRSFATTRYEYRPEKGGRVYTLRGAKGAALALYVLASTGTYRTLPTKFLRPRKPIQALASGPDFVTRLSVTELDQFAAWVPRSGKVTVVAHEGGLTAVAMS